MENDTKILAIAVVVLLALGFLSFAFTGNIIKQKSRGYEERQMTTVMISNDDINYYDDELLDVKYGKHVYFKINTGYPFGTNSLVKFFWYPDETTGIKSNELYKGGDYIEGCGKPYCRGGFDRELKHLTLGLERGLNCAVFYDRGFEEEIKLCFNVI